MPPTERSATYRTVHAFFGGLASIKPDESGGGEDATGAYLDIFDCVYPSNVSHIFSAEVCASLMQGICNICVDKSSRVKVRAKFLGIKYAPCDVIVCFPTSLVITRHLKRFLSCARHIVGRQVYEEWVSGFHGIEIKAGRKRKNDANAATPRWLLSADQEAGLLDKNGYLLTVFLTRVVNLAATIIGGASTTPDDDKGAFVALYTSHMTDEENAADAAENADDDNNNNPVEPVKHAAVHMKVDVPYDGDLTFADVTANNTAEFLQLYSK